MKLRVLVFACLTLLVSQQVFAEIKVKFFVGDSTYKSLGSDEWKKISMNQLIGNGDTVKTTSKAYVQLDLDGNLVKISENSEVTIGEDFDNERKVKSMDMEYGNLQLKMNKLKKSNEGFKVNTVTSVCAVRGTEFDVSAGYDGTTLLQVQKGQVALAGATKEVLVNENQQSTVPFGGNPTEVKTIEIADWKEWAQKSKENIKGNEKDLLQTCLEKIKVLEKDIIDLEQIRDKNFEDKEKYDKLAKDAKAAGDEEKFKENASLAYKALRYANSASYKTYLKAYRMKIVLDMADRIFLSISDNKTNEIEQTYQEIQSIYNKYYEKYIQATIEAKRKRQEQIDKQNNE